MTTSRQAPLAGILFVVSLVAASVWPAMSILAAVLFVWFLVVLRRRLVVSQKTPGAGPLFAFGAGIVALALSVGAVVGAYGVDASAELVFVMVVAGQIVVGLFMFAASFTGIRRRAIPGWLGWMGEVAGVITIVAAVSVVFAPLVFIGWVLVISVWMTWKPGGIEAPTSGPPRPWTWSAEQEQQVPPG